MLRALCDLPAQVYLQRVPQLVGKRFGEIAFHLPMATVYGIVQFATRRCLLLPPLDTVLQVCCLIRPPRLLIL